MPKDLFILISTFRLLKPIILPAAWWFSIYLCLKEGLSFGLFVASLAAGFMVYAAIAIISGEEKNVALEKPLVTAIICTILILGGTVAMQANHFPKWPAMTVAISMIWSIAAGINFFKKTSLEEGA